MDFLIKAAIGKIQILNPHAKPSHLKDNKIEDTNKKDRKDENERADFKVDEEDKWIDAENSFKINLKEDWGLE